MVDAQSRTQAWFCIILNQLILPGLGSFYIGRTSPATLQLTISVVALLILLIAQWMTVAGVLLLVAWVMAMKTSIHVYNTVH